MVTTLVRGNQGPLPEGSPRKRAVAILLACSLIAGDLSAQSPVDLTLVKDLEIGGDPGAAYSVNVITNVRPWADGFILNNAVGAAHVLMLASAEGEWTQFIDRAGDGPGEFRSIHHLGEYGDSLLVQSLDVTTVLTPELQYGRQFRMPGLVFSLRGNSRAILYTGERLYGPGTANVWLTSLNGDVTRVLDWAKDTIPGEIARSNFRAATLTGDTVFLVSRTGTEMSAFSATSGALLYSIETPVRPPGAQTIELVTDGRACALLLATDQTPLASGDSFEFRKIRNSEVVVFDCGTGALRARYVGPEGLTGLLPDFRAVEIRLREGTGEMFVVVYSLRGDA